MLRMPPGKSVVATESIVDRGVIADRLGGRVWAVTARGDFDPVDGIGALLRY